MRASGMQGLCSPTSLARPLPPCHPRGGEAESRYAVHFMVMGATERGPSQPAPRWQNAAQEQTPRLQPTQAQLALQMLSLFKNDFTCWIETGEGRQTHLQPCCITHEAPLLQVGVGWGLEPGSLVHHHHSAPLCRVSKASPFLLPSRLAVGLGLTRSASRHRD